MKKKNLLAAVAVCAAMLISGCSSKSSGSEYVLFSDKTQTTQSDNKNTEAMQMANYEAKIVPNNRLSVLVFNHPELSTRDVRAQVDPRQERGALVAPDGSVNLPLVGVIRVGGLTSREASTLLARQYATYIQNSHVTVDILNKRVFVLGEVRSPGRVDIVEDSTNLLEVLASAGDMTDFAAKTRIKIIRGTRQKPEVETIDLTRLSALSPYRLTLYPNDVVYVEPNDYKQRNTAIAEAIPGIDIAARILGLLFTGKQLTNTRVFNVNSYKPYPQ
jgi:polysaccharide export outer membrane protein